MKIRMWNIILVLLLVLILTAGSAGAKMIVKYGHVGPPVHPQHLGALAFAKHISEKSQGEITVDVFPMGQLGGERSMTEQVQGGTLHMTATTSGVLANFVPEIGIIELPFIYPNRAVAYKVLDDEAVKSKLAAFCEAKGFVFIGYTENEFRDLTNSKRPIQTPDDLQGLKIRVIESPVFIDTFKALGANPTPLPFPELYNALQQKVIDAQDSPIYTSILMKFTEVNKYATLTSHILTECPVVVNKVFWSKLKPEHKKLFMEAADIQIRINREENARNRVEAVKKAKEQGVEVVILTDAQREHFQNATQTVREKYRKVFGPAWYDFYLKKIADYSTAK